MDERATFRKHIRNALIHLYDTAHLECHPLVSQLLTPVTANRLTHAQMLRRLLKDVIEALRPRHGNPSTAPEWRSYMALRSLYVKGTSFLEVQEELGISRRQLQREVSKGIDALAAILWEQRVASDEELPLPATINQTEAELLQQELANWRLDRQTCQVRTLIDDVGWLLNPLLNEYDKTLQLDMSADLAPVFVDPTLTRQALFRILRLVLHHADLRQIMLHTRPGSKKVDMVLPVPGVDISQNNKDWEIAALLLTRQGSELSLNNAPDTGPEIVISLPLASQELVLVIDDARGIHRLFERYLAPHNYQVYTISDGATALKHAIDLAPDMIILDVMMPKVDGWQVLRGLQAEARTKQIPVVVCSVLNEPELALSLGAWAFVKKPVNRLALLNTLEQIRDASATEPAASPTQNASN